MFWAAMDSKNMARVFWGGSPELVQTKTHTSRKYKKNLYSKVLSKLKIVILSSPHHLIFVVFVCQ